MRNAEWKNRRRPRGRGRRGNRRRHLPSAIRNRIIPHSAFGIPHSSGPRPLVRRIFDPPLLLPPRPRHEPDGWLLSGLEGGAASHLRGPYMLAGGWWDQAEQRDYYFVALRRGDVFWVYRDRLNRRWFLQGRVE